MAADAGLATIKPVELAPKVTPPMIKFRLELDLEFIHA